MSDPVSKGNPSTPPPLASSGLAQSTYQRWRDSPKGVVSVQEQESKQADYNSAKARLSSANAEVAADQGEVDRLRTMANFKNITVPFDGVVTARETDVGALINAGSGTGGGSGPELSKVADIHMMRVYVHGGRSLKGSVPNVARKIVQYPHVFCAGLALAAIVVSLGAQSATAASADQSRLGRPLPHRHHFYASCDLPTSACTNEYRDVQ